MCVVITWGSGSTGGWVCRYDVSPNDVHLQQLPGDGTVTGKSEEALQEIPMWLPGEGGEGVGERRLSQGTRT